MLPQRRHFKTDNFERLLLFQVKIKKSGLFLGKLSDLLYKSQFLQILAMKKLIIFTKLRNVGGYEKISREQLESIFAGLILILVEADKLEKWRQQKNKLISKTLGTEGMTSKLVTFLSL